MKYSGVPSGKYHAVKDDGSAVCGLLLPEQTWGAFEIPDELLHALPMCGSCAWLLEQQDKQAHEVTAHV